MKLLAWPKALALRYELESLAQLAQNGTLEDKAPHEHQKHHCRGAEQD
jgi:hypothetical protein